MIQALSDALAERGYDTLTAVQRAVTEDAHRDADLLVSAQTGSGKTVGFGLAIAPTILEDAETFGPAGKPLALVVAPTRELAFQVMRELSWLFAKAGAQVASCVGGMDMRDERRVLDRGAHMVVGTPGRLRDHIQRGSLDLGAIRAIVLDEADEMLDLGFREDLEFMLGEAPAERRTLMFSATVPPQIARLAQQFQRDAVRVTTLSEKSQHSDIAYQVLRVAQMDAENAIINVLRFHDAQNAIVFGNTRSTVNRLTARLANRGFAVVALSGELSQTERTHALQAMRDGRARVCVATDVAARGIDLPNLELVIHAELPSNAEGLLHRSGRTGRAGRKGTSALIVPPRAMGKAQRLLGLARIDAEWTVAPSAEEILRRDEERLLADPVWSDETTEEERAFAAKLLAQHAPDRIAAAYLRLYRARQSAPEDLGAPDDRPPPNPRQSFDGGAWFALSVGQEDRAEARWLLPLICRAGDVDKTAIGAIRVRQSETFVEISADSVAGFVAALDGRTEIEKGVRIRKLDAAPDFASPKGDRAGPARQRNAAARPVPVAVGTPARPPEPRQSARPDAEPQPDERSSERKPRHDRAVKPQRPKASGRVPAAADRHPGPASRPGATGEAAERAANGPERQPRQGGSSGAKRAPASATVSRDAADTSKRFTPPGKTPARATPGTGQVGAPGSPGAGKSGRRGPGGGAKAGPGGTSGAGKPGPRKAGAPGKAGPGRFGVSGGNAVKPGRGGGPRRGEL